MAPLDCLFYVKPNTISDFTIWKNGVQIYPGGSSIESSGVEGEYLWFQYSGSGGTATLKATGYEDLEILLFEGPPEYYTMVSLPQPISNISDGTNTYVIKDAEARVMLSNKQDTLVSGTNIKTINNTSILGSGNLTLDGLPSQTGQSGKFLITDGTDASWGVVKTHNLLEFKWADHQLNDIQWLRADTFSWQSGNVYTSAYNHLVQDIQGITAETETIGSYTVTFYRATDGHKICLADQEQTVLNIYNTYGIAWYYILDTTNTQFKLPRTKYGFEGLRTNVGDKIDESLPNITGSITNSNGTPYYQNNTQFIGVFYNSGNVASTSNSNTSGSHSIPRDLKFDASRSSSTYQDNAPVQERATQMYLYFYVGDYSQTAIEQTAGITSEQLNAKVDVNSLSEIYPVIETYVNGTSGYNLYSNGYCEQWGQATYPQVSANSANSANSTTVSLIKTFANTNYNISHNILTDAGNTTELRNFKTTKNTNSIIFGWYSTMTLSGTGQFCWSACGYIS